MDETDGNHGPTCRLIEWFRPLSPCPPQAGCWCSRRERRPYVRLIVLGNGPRHASGLRTSDTGQTAGDLSPGKDPLTLIRSCEACSAFTRVAARTLARSPIRDPLYRRLQPFCHLHDCSGCFRLERLPGGTCTHWKAPPFHGAHPKQTFLEQGPKKRSSTRCRHARLANRTARCHACDSRAR